MLKTIESSGDLTGKQVLMRSDFSVPLKGGVITDDGRIRAALPTSKKLLDGGAKVIMMAHLGRPKGQINPEFSLAPVAKRLEELIGAKVTLAADTAGVDAQAKAEALPAGEILMLENVRFDPRETSKDNGERTEFAAEMAKLTGLFISDGLEAVHRKQASVYDIAELLPAAAGLLVVKEIESLRKAMDNPERPHTVVLGGSKVPDKLGVIANLLAKADSLITGGGMTFTFLAAQGCRVGKSLLESDQIDTVKDYLERAKQNGVDLVLPIDVMVAPELKAEAPAITVSTDAIPEGQMRLDTGPKSHENFAAKIVQSKTAAWNGPMGVFEFEALAAGTKAVAQALQDGDCFSVVSGGDSAATVRLLGFDESKFSHISTSGGVSLELLEGKVLPGIAASEG